MGKVRNVTLQDIANQVGVSKGLVSLAISGKYGVSEEMRKKILVVAAEMGYQIDKTRYFLRNMKRTALLVSNNELESQTFWNQVIRGIQSFTYNNNIALSFILIDELKRENVISKILESRVSGVIALGDLPNAEIEQLAANAIPTVLIDSKHYFKSYIDHVRANNYAGGFEMARFCLEREFEDIVFVGDTKYAMSFLERYNGFRKCMEDFGKNDVTYLIEPGETDCLNLFSGTAFAARLDRKCPDIVACVNDVTAKYVYETVLSRGLRIPEEISVISFDGSEMCETLKPTLTSVGFSRVALGEEACLLLESRKKGVRNYPVTILLPVQVCERNSVRR